MYLIVGLGNPGKEYEFTRHNMGFNVIDKIIKDCGIKVSQSKFKGMYTQDSINGEKVLILKPQTYMNLSGESVAAFRNFYKIDNKDIIVIYDDIDLDEGTIRIRKKGSSGTHNGMKSVIQCLGTEEFTRVRVGIGKPRENEDIIKYVIGTINKNIDNPIPFPKNNVIHHILKITAPTNISIIFIFSFFIIQYISWHTI